jgi:hypothetical protein
MVLGMGPFGENNDFLIRPTQCLRWYNDRMSKLDFSNVMIPNAEMSNF